MAEEKAIPEKAQEKVHGDPLEHLDAAESRGITNNGSEPEKQDEPLK